MEVLRRVANAIEGVDSVRLLDMTVLAGSRHHHLLHMPGWHAKLAPDGRFEVTGPDGRHWVTYPPGATPPLC